MTTILIIFGVLVTTFFAWRIYFLRDPDRSVPEGKTIQSPADGTILYIKKITEGEVPVSIKNGNTIRLDELSGLSETALHEGWLIGIFMSPMSVHRNRIPISGTVSLRKAFAPGRATLSMILATTDVLLRRKPYRDYPFYLANERVTIGIQSEIGTLFVTQIADKWIRKIVADVKPGEKVQKGDKYGLIRFGSQCDLFIPAIPELSIRVQPGQYVYAGQTIIATYDTNNTTTEL